MDRVICQNCLNSGLTRNLAITPGPGTFITRRAKKTPGYAEDTEYRLTVGNIVCSECKTVTPIESGTVVAHGSWLMAHGSKRGQFLTNNLSVFKKEKYLLL